jgi:hypothetical protein
MSLLFALVLTAHAGWFGDFCERHLIIADDPYQYEHLSSDALVKAYRHYGAQAYWTKNEREARTLRTLGDELRRRPQTDEVVHALDDYQKFEWRRTK